MTLLSVNQVSDKLGVRQETVLRYIHEGKLKAMKLPSGWRIEKGDLQAYLEKYGIKGDV